MHAPLRLLRPRSPLPRPSRGSLLGIARLTLVAMGTLCVHEGGAQELRALSDTFLDPRARSIFAAARERWLEVDSSIQSYEAIIQSRAAISIRSPLKDRTLFRAEAAARARWSADSTVVVQMLAANEVTPEGRSPAGTLAFTDAVFDPTGDRLYFGFRNDEDDDDDEEGASVEFEHPIALGSEEHYRYGVADSLRLSLPDGRSLQAVGLELIPRLRSGRLLSGMLWVEPSSGAVIRAMYRLATEFDLEAELGLDEEAELRLVPGMLRPFEFDISMVVVEYSLWDFQYWLPSRIRMEGFARAGIVRVPGSYEQSYRILDVVGADDPGDLEDAEMVAERWRTDGVYGEFREELPEEPTDAEPDSAAGNDAAHEDADDEPRRFLLVPVNDQDLVTSELLPPPIWDEAPGFASDDQLEDFVRDLANLSVPEAGRSRFRASWGPEIGDLFRYNRVEGPSVGARVEWTRATGGGPVGLVGSGWVGIGTWVPDVRLGLSWELARHRLSASGYHRVEEVDPRARNLSVGNSLNALFFGRDDGDYFRSSGARLRWEPTRVRRPWYHLTLSAEEHSALPNKVDFSMVGLLGGDDTPFRPALEADAGTEFAAVVGIEPWWGVDARGAQGGLEILLQGAGGDFTWFRVRTVGRAAVPLFGGVRAGLELGVGRIWGEAPLQRNWFLGGTRTLRGYPGAAAVGTSYARGRVELARELSAARLTVFSDWGWAGEQSEFDFDNGLVSAGVGLSVLDGLMRFDLARALKAPTGWRVELYLDSVL